MAKKDPIRFSYLKKLAGEYSMSNLDSAVFYAELLIREATTAQDEIGLAKGYSGLADVYNQQGRYEDALKALDKSLVLCRKLQLTKGITVGLFLQGNILQNLHRYDAADSLYRASMQVAEEQGDTAMLANIFSSLGINYDYLGDTQQATDYYLRSADMFRAGGNDIGLSRSLTNLAIVLADIKEYDKAIGYME